jgi:hypothetical protein
MAFSQQTYTGQGIVQPTERSRVGEFLGAGLAGLGQSIGRGIEKFAERKEEMKKREQFKKGTITALTALGADADLLKGMEASELAAYAQMYPEIQAQREREEAQGFYSEMLRAYQPQQVEKDFGPQISAAEQRLIEAQQGGFRPEFTFPRSSEVPAASQEPAPADLSKFYGEPGFADKLGDWSRSSPQLPDWFASEYNAPSFERLSGGLGAGLLPRSPQAPSPAPAKPVKRGADISQREEMRAMRRAGAFAAPPSASERPAATQPAAPSQPMGPEPALEPSPEVQQAARDLEAIRIQAAEGDTRLETSQEVMRRISENIPELAEKYPTQAKNLYEMLYPKQDKLTPTEQISLMKLEREIGASTVTGYGVAPSPEIAKEFREILISATEAQTGIKRLLEINEMDSPWASLDLRSEAGVLQGTLQGALRREIVGPGAVTESEQKLLKSIIRDPTKFWSLSSSNKTALETLLKKVERGLAKNAEVISWQQPMGTQTGQAQRPMGRTVSYGMSGKPEIR